MGGCLLTDKLAWGATAFSIANTPPDPAIVGDRWRDMWIERLENNGLWMLDWFRHQRRDELYAHGSICENYADVDVPVYMVGGWADGYTNAVFRTLDRLPGPRKGLVGPWAHKYPHFAKPGPRIGFLQECLRWWDQHLKGIETGIMDEPMLRAWIQEPAAPATFRERRDGRWVAEPDWNGKAIETKPLFPGNAGLTETASGDTIVVDSPQNAGWTSGSWCSYGTVPDAAADQAGEAGLMVSFETASLGEDLDLLGSPMLHADVASDAAQANLAAVLSAVDEDGRTTLISFGVLNLTHRSSDAEPEAMPEGVRQPVTVQLNACGQRVSKGQRLRLSLASAYWPVIWPSQTVAKLTLANAKLDLPVRREHASDADLPDFQRPESAEPLATTRHSDGSFERTRTVDFVTGRETQRRISDTGSETHLHTGMTVRYTTSEAFEIHPDDPNSATGTMNWLKSYRRGDWKAEVETEVVVRALRDHWRITASLTARDAEGEVISRDWSEDVPRDLV